MKRKEKKERSGGRNIEAIPADELGAHGVYFALRLFTDLG